MKKTLLATIFILLNFIPRVALADDGSTPPSLLDVATKIPNIINIIIAVSVSVFFIILVVAGYQFITALGDKEKIQSAQKSIFFSVIGFALIFASFLIIQVIFNLTKTQSGVGVDPNTGGILPTLQSNYVPTTIPASLLKKSDKLPTGNGGTGDGVNNTNIDPSATPGGALAGKVTNGISYGGQNCTIGYLNNGTPIFYQFIPTNPVFTGGGPNSDCSKFGEYSTSSEASIWGGCSCAAGSLSTVVGTWIIRYNADSTNSTKISQILSMHEVINEMQRRGSIVCPGGYTNNLTTFQDTANSLMTSHNFGLQFHEFTGYFSGDKNSGISKVASVANAGHPVIVNMINHFLTVLHVDESSNTVTVADTGQITILSKYNALHGYDGTLNTQNGTQTTSIQEFIDNWVGTAYIIEPTNDNTNFN